MATWIAVVWGVSLAGRTAPATGEAFWIPLVAGAVALVTAPFVARTWQSFRDPCAHGSVRRFGRFATLAAFFGSVAPDDAHAPAEQVGTLYFGPGLLMAPTFVGVDLVLVKDIAWIYVKESKVKTHAVVTVATLHAVCMHTFEGDTRDVPVEVYDTEARVRRLMAFVAARAPWVELGYDPSVRARWTNGASREGLLAPIRTRRDDVLAARASSRSGSPGQQQ